MVVTAAQVRLLVRVPATLGRAAIIRTVQREAGTVLRRVAGLAPRLDPFWGDRAWCFTLSNGISVAAVRRHILDRTQGATAPGSWSGANSFGEDLEI